jgi:rRNA maturation RNase YbeY
VVKAARSPLGPDRVREVLRAAFADPLVAARVRDLTGGSVTCELTLRIASDTELRRLNREFLGEDHATDVLSFPSGTAGEDGYLGDLAISWPTVRRQAAQFGHSMEDEALLLCVHGLLHLLGWDHADPDEEREMIELTLACLARSGIVLAESRLNIAD